MNDLEAAAGVREGDVLAGKYRVERILGVGGMGVVIAAHHIQLDERVALKFLRPEMLFGSDATARFAREARAAVKIKSEHVARVSDVGVLENGAPYMVMEYLQGGDLAAWLQEHGPLPVEQATEFLLQASEAIAEAHVLGIVHRDLKPANLFVFRRADGVLSIKVLDFGISKVTNIGAGTDRAITKTSALMGSPLYMSPEQMQTPKDVDSRSDIWALGVILYEVLAGVSPFIAETIPELVLKIVSSPPEPLRNKRPDLPVGIETIVLKCLEKDRERRYRNVGELALALSEFASKRARNSVERIAGVMRAAGFTDSLSTAPPSSDAFAPKASQTIAPLGRTLPSASGAKKAFGALAGLAILVALGAVVLLRHGAAAQDSAPISAAGSAVQPKVVPQTAADTGAKTERPAAGVVSAAVTPETLPTEAPLRPSRPASNPVRRTPATQAPPAASVEKPPVSHPVAAAPSKKPNCEPNFYLDAQGEKHFKPECF